MLIHVTLVYAESLPQSCLWHLTVQHYHWFCNAAGKMPYNRLYHQQSAHHIACSFHSTAIPENTE
ncbi:MAG: hypothetical protein ACTSYF_09740 [Promethearchaeota archaeon]